MIRLFALILMMIAISHLSQAQVIKPSPGDGYIVVNFNIQLGAGYAYIMIIQNNAQELQGYRTIKIEAKKLQDNSTNYRFTFLRKKSIIVKEINVAFEDSWKEVVAAAIFLSQNQMVIKAFNYGYYKKGVKGENLTIVHDLESIGGFIKVYAEVDVSNVSQPAITVLNISCIQETVGCNQNNTQQLYNAYEQLYTKLYSLQGNGTKIDFNMIPSSLEKVNNSFVLKGRLAPLQIEGPSLPFTITFNDQRFLTQLN